MFGSIGGPELILIAVLALLLFGPRRLPQLGRTFGKALAEFRNASRDFKISLEREVELEEVKQTGRELASVSRELRGSVRETADSTAPTRAAGARCEDRPPSEPEETDEAPPPAAPDRDGRRER